MVDPKKDYELLMRYLQGGEGPRKPIKPHFGDEWKPMPKPATVAVEPRPQPVKPVVAPPVIKSDKRNFTFNLKLKPVSWRKGARWGIAVLSAVLLLAFLWNSYYFYKLTPETLFNELYVPFKVTNETPGAAKKDLEHYYATGNYVAVSLQSKKQPKLSDREQLLTSLAYLHREDYTKAIKRLEPLSNNFKSPYRQQAEYYLALTYLKNEDYDRCIEVLERIRHLPSHQFRSRISERTISDIKLLKWK